MSDDIGNKPVETAGRASNGRFTSGNPGRPRGARNKHSLTSYRALAEMSSTALVQLINNVMAGDQRAIEYILDRILPQGRLIELDPTVEGVSEALNAAEVVGLPEFVRLRSICFQGFAGFSFLRLSRNS